MGMPILACPQCGAMNDAASPACEMCGALSDAVSPRTTWLLTSACVTAVAYVVGLVLGLSPVAPIAAMFWGPLIAAWIAPRDVVWPAAIGGLVGAAAIVALAVMVDWGSMQPLVSAMTRHVNPVVAVLRVGFVLLAIPATSLPFSYAGASAGGRLAEARRRAFAAIVAAAPRLQRDGAAPMSDDELSKVRL
jgi:hypothetical protein